MRVSVWPRFSDTTCIGTPFISARLAGNAYGAAGLIKVMHLEPRELTVARTGLQGCLRQVAEVTGRCIEQPLRLGNRKVTFARYRHVAERLEPAAPRVVTRHAAVGIGMVQRRP